MKSKYKHIFEPFTVKHMTIKNRIVMTPMGKKTVRWIQPEDLDERMSSSRNILAKDRFDQPVFLFENDFALRWFADKYPDVTLEEKM